MISLYVIFIACRTILLIKYYMHVKYLLWVYFIYCVFVVLLQYQILYDKNIFLALGNSPSDDVKLLFIDDIVCVMLYLYSFSINVKVIYQFGRMKNLTRACMSRRFCNRSIRGAQL